MSYLMSQRGAPNKLRGRRRAASPSPSHKNTAPSAAESVAHKKQRGSKAVPSAAGVDAVHAAAKVALLQQQRSPLASVWLWLRPPVNWLFGLFSGIAWRLIAFSWQVAVTAAVWYLLFNLFFIVNFNKWVDAGDVAMAAFNASVHYSRHTGRYSDQLSLWDIFQAFAAVAWLLFVLSVVVAYYLGRLASFFIAVVVRRMVAFVVQVTGVVVLPSLPLA